ncbi:DUF6670 family protein [Acinetobacter sp. NIPH 2699]|uniref:DUF6670 family protein n=1 Tax=Acinetobacter sp. NIPH 2699 TaxID=2923433 RepID=UPI001F4C205C|nr:DUF6670 family protein [Acinetobacter sp. NIPH 2699]MCH7337917.1 hypothetical protein [Acinetobacter sp. NIPH 2699]
MSRLFPKQIIAPKPLHEMIDYSGKRNGRPFDVETETHTPQGKYTCVHYGVMIPNLPEPFNFLNLLTVVGQPRVKIFRNEHLIKTSSIDTANVLIGTAIGTKDYFKGYSIKNDCALVSNGSSLCFGRDLVLEGTYPNFHAYREGHEFNFDLKITATDKVANFAELTFGLYNHWALLCQYEGYLEYQGKKTHVEGLCTYEYARAIDINLHMNYFTYHILNIDEKTQVLLVEVLGPLNLVLQRRVYIRAIDDHGSIHSEDFKLEVHEFESQRSITPNGLSMRLPRTFSWSVNDEKGKLLICIDGLANGDFKYGMAGGYAGSYQYKGTFRGQAVEGIGYIEYLDTRTK